MKTSYQLACLSFPANSFSSHLIKKTEAFFSHQVLHSYWQLQQNQIRLSDWTTKTNNNKNPCIFQFFTVQIIFLLLGKMFMKYLSMFVVSVFLTFINCSTDSHIAFVPGLTWNDKVTHDLRVAKHKGHIHFFLFLAHQYSYLLETFNCHVWKQMQTNKIKTNYWFTTAKESATITCVGWRCKGRQKGKWKVQGRLRWPWVEALGVDKLQIAT